MTATKEEIKEIENRVRKQIFQEQQERIRIALAASSKLQKSEKMKSQKLMEKVAKIEKQKLNYSKLPEKVKSAIQPIDYELEIETKLTWDGRQFVVRIPKEIVDGYNITKQNRMMFRFVKFSPLSDKGQEKPTLEISVI